MSQELGTRKLSAAILRYTWYWGRGKDADCARVHLPLSLRIFPHLLGESRKQLGIDDELWKLRSGIVPFHNQRRPESKCSHGARLVVKK